jgi:predicted dehydrogenase
MGWNVSDQLRVGVAGTGFIGRVHARSARLAGATLAGVAASTPERSKAAAQQMRTIGFATASELATSDEIDVLHICTPNHLHLPLALEALEAGKHVVVEKPIGRDAKEATQLLEAAQRSGLVAAVPFVYRFYPVIRDLRERTRRGDLGALRLLHGSYLQDWLTDETAYNWRVDPALGGASRAFADIGSHWCDLVEFVTGHRITRLVADMVTAIPERTVSDHMEAFGSGDASSERQAIATEDSASLLFRTDKGAAGSVTISQISPGRRNRLWFEIDGAKGSASFNQQQPETAWLGTTQGATIVARDPATLGTQASGYATLPGGHPQGYHDCFDAFVADTYEAIRSAAPDGLPTVVDGLRSAQITDAVVASARSGTWVEVAS